MRPARTDDHSTVSAEALRRRYVMLHSVASALTGTDPSARTKYVETPGRAVAAEVGRAPGEPCEAAPATRPYTLGSHIERH